MVIYNPITNTVISCRKLDYDDAIDEKISSEIFYELYMQTDKISEVIIGVSLCNRLYQLSPAQYGTYIKESASTTQFFNKSKFLVAVADYQKQHHIPFD